MALFDFIKRKRDNALQTRERYGTQSLTHGGVQNNITGLGMG